MAKAHLLGRSTRYQAASCLSLLSVTVWPLLAGHSRAGPSTSLYATAILDSYLLPTLNFCKCPKCAPHRAAWQAYKSLLLSLDALLSAYVREDVPTVCGLEAEDHQGDGQVQWCIGLQHSCMVIVPGD